MAEPWRVAIIGAGIGAQHLEAYRQLPDRFDVGVICDRDAARAAPLVGGGARHEATLDAVLTDPDIQIVDICLPTHLHVEATLASLAEGKHVICEKPLATSLAEVDRIANAEAKAGRTVFPVFQYRYGPAARQLQALIASGLAGRAFAATLETHWNRDAAYYANPWRGTWAGEMGGAILTHAIHIHDWLSMALGPVAELRGVLATRVNAIETDDCAALAIRLESGALATSSVTLGAARDETRLRFLFEGLTAESGRNPYAPAEDSWSFTARAPVEQEHVDRVLASVAAGVSGYQGFFSAVADALAGDDGNAVRLADARASIEFVTAAYATARLGQAETLPIGREHPYYKGWGPG